MADGLPAKAEASEAPPSWWWCTHCHSYTDLDDAGDPYPKCEKCSHRVHLREPDPSADCEVRSAELQRAPLPDWNVEAKPRTKPKKDRAGRAYLSRLPAEKRNLRVLAVTGYWFCYECLQITEEAKDGGCLLCGEGLDRAINWNEPISVEVKEKAAA